VSPPPPAYPLGGGIGSLSSTSKGPFYRKGQLVISAIENPIVTAMRTFLPHFLLPALAAFSNFVSNPIVQGVVLLLILLFSALPAAIALLLTLVALPITALVSLWLTPLGREIPLAGPYLDVTAEPTPPGTSLVNQMDSENVGSGFSEAEVGGLNYSEAHSDRRVPKLLAEWVESLPGRAPLAAAQADGVAS
jgi:hypothetical protein